MLRLICVVLAAVSATGRLVSSSEETPRRDVLVSVKCAHSETVPVTLSRPKADEVTLVPSADFDCGIDMGGNLYKISGWLMDASPSDLPILPGKVRALAQNGALRAVQASATLLPVDPEKAPFSKLVSTGIIWASTSANADSDVKALTIPPVGTENLPIFLPADNHRSLFLSEIPDVSQGVSMTLIKELDTEGKPQAFLFLEKPLRASATFEAALAAIDSPVIDQSVLNATEEVRKTGEPIRLLVKVPSQAAN